MPSLVSWRLCEYGLGNWVTSSAVVNVEQDRVVTTLNIIFSVVSVLLVFLVRHIPCLW